MVSTTGSDQQPVRQRRSHRLSSRLGSDELPDEPRVVVVEQETELLSASDLPPLSDVPLEPAVDSKTTIHDLKAAPRKEFEDNSLFTSWTSIESVVAPILFTLLGAFLRLYRIGAASRVIWDEAHFGKFGSKYLKHTYYFDVHPPLGKMLCGLSGYIAGYNGTFGFESGVAFPDTLDYTTMRVFNSAFAILTVPVAYFTAKAMGLSLPAVWLTTLMVACELSFSVLARFILLDSMLMLFTVLTFLCLLKFHQYRRQPFSFSWLFWMAATGTSIGLTTSVKMVGLFVMAVVGVYTVVELWALWGDRTVRLTSYALHWVVRSVTLLLIPLVIFAICFRIHFALLYKNGDGQGSMSSLFQANLEGNDIVSGPLDVAYGSTVTLRSQGINSGLLHSHVQTYPSGSKQQQVTTYSHLDSNNNWMVQYARGEPAYDHDRPVQRLQNGDVVRLVHVNTNRNLHTHQVDAPIARSGREVSGYGNEEIGDEKDNWVVEIMETVGNDNASLVHPLTTGVRFRSQPLGCYLAITNNALPEWGFKQGEVACVPPAMRRNKNLWWTVDTHVNQRLPDAVNRTLPRSKFLRDFVQLNFAQMASNNALVTDKDKRDDLASVWWQWPILNRGLRMCSWNESDLRYYLLGTPTTVWLSTAGVATFLVWVGVLVLMWQRGAIRPTPAMIDDLVKGGILPFLGWFFHYLPFVIMSRVTYIHHYMPALYFAILLLNYQLDVATRGRPLAVRLGVFGLLGAVTGGCAFHFRHLVFGMTGPLANYDYLKWVKTWHIT